MLPKTRVSDPELYELVKEELYRQEHNIEMIASESTVKEAGPGFAVRRLDKVRVMGISTPVQLYEVIGYASEISAEKQMRIRYICASV